MRRPFAYLVSARKAALLLAATATSFVVGTPVALAYGSTPAFNPAASIAEWLFPERVPQPGEPEAPEPTVDPPTVPTAPTSPANDADTAATSVHLTARLAESFSLTIRSSGIYDFGAREVGKRYSSPRMPILTVRSNRPWEFSDSSDSVITSVPGKLFPRPLLFRHVTEPGMNRILRPGMYEITARYWLDLTDDSLLGLPSETVIATDMGYTIVQR